MAKVRRIGAAGRHGSASPQRRRDHLLAELAGRQHGAVAAWQLLQIGFTRAEIRARIAQGRLHEIHFGVYAVGHRAITQEGAWIAATLAVGPDAHLSHRDALSAFEIADYRQADIDVTLPGLGSRRRTGIRVHRTRRLDPADRASLSGIPVTSLARTLADIAGCVSPRHLRDAYLEAGRRNLIDAHAMERMVETGRGKRGIRHLRRLLEEDTAKLMKTKSPLEVRFFDFCRRHGFPDPLPNHWVHGFEVDAYWPEARLVVELDSWEFHRGRKAFERDRVKIGDLTLVDLDVLPVTDARLKNEPEKLAEIIRRAFARHNSPR